jgi:hypothetical protein
MPLTLPSSKIKPSTLNSSSTGGRSVDQDLVEHRPPWCVRRGVTLGRPGRAVDHEGTEIETVVLDRWAACCQHRVQESQTIECGDAGSVDDMGRKRVARKLCPVDYQHAVTPPRQQHRRGGACASRADHDRIVLITHPNLRNALPSLEIIGWL